MTRATVIVQKWNSVLGWCYKTGYPVDDEDLALDRAKTLENVGIPTRVYRRTSDGPEVIYESPKEG